MHPTLLNGCARAATAAEARFRIDRPIAGRSARVVALDAEAAEVTRRVAELPWHDARFLELEDGAWLDWLDGADVTIVVATSDDGAEAAAAIAHACDERGIMTAGVIFGERDAAVSALRPYAPVLLVTDDERDVAELLTALRA